MRNLLFIISFFCCLNVNAQDVEQRFTKANEFYQKGNFNQALDSYLEIENQGVESTELYFNIANCYYQLNKVAPTIFYYEKSLKLDPSNSDAKTNLNFAKGLLMDKIEPLPKTFIEKLSDKYVLNKSDNTWAWFSVLFLFFSVIFFATYLFVENPTQKVFLFVVFICFLISTIFCTIFALNVKQYSKNHKEAIIFNKEVEVKSGPSDKAPEAFKLHEGTKVSIIEMLEDWQKIKIADGQTGWMDKGALKMIE